MRFWACDWKCAYNKASFTTSFRIVFEKLILRTFNFSNLVKTGNNLRFLFFNRKIKKTSPRKEIIVKPSFGLIYNLTRCKTIFWPYFRVTAVLKLVLQKGSLYITGNKLDGWWRNITTRENWLRYQRKMSNSLQALMS